MMINYADYTVLYAEDDVISNEIVSSMLSTKFKSVVSVQNGLRGFQQFKKIKPDLIITDLNMPVMCGCEMIKNIREVNTDVPVIITTAYPEHLFGDLMYLTKPISADNLFKMIDQVLSGQLRVNLGHEFEFYERRHPNGNLSQCHS